MDLIQSAKSGNDFTNHDPLSYQITIVQQSTAEFFRAVLDTLPETLPPNFSNFFLNTPDLSREIGVYCATLI